MLLIEAAINRYIELDPEMLDKLAVFDGKVIKIEIVGTGKTLFMFPGKHGIHISMTHEGEVDTVLRGSPLSLFKMGVVPNAATMLLKGEVEISGNMRLGHQFKSVFSQMDIDWSEPLAELVGDALAYQMQQSGKKLSQWGKDSIRSVSTSLSEYLQEESRDVVTATELEIFNDAVDQIRNDVDRLQAKINLLRQN